MLSSEDLKLTEEEYAALLKTREQIASGCVIHQNASPGHEVPEDIEGAGFNMATTGMSHSCGSIACIGGWMRINMALDRGLIESPLSWIGTKLAQDYVYSKETTPIGRLFFPSEIRADSWWDITPEQAVQAIDNFLETGKPRWAKIASEE